MPSDTSGRSLVVVGGDSLIGRQLLIDCEEMGISALASTRRRATAGANRFFLDMAGSRLADCLPQLSSPIIIVAAQTGFSACEIDPTTEKINIEAPVQLAKAALAANRRVIFISTSSVFDGELPLCNEDDEVNPTAAYSIQKAEAERQLSALPGWATNGAVVRLTKVLAPGTAPIPAWRAILGRGEPIAPFSDLVFAPISLEFASRSLIEIAFSPHCGNFHLSGVSDVTYADFARAYLAAQQLSQALVAPTTSAQAKVALFYRPRYGALGMARTLRLTSIAPQSLSSVIADLLQSEKFGKKVG